MGARVLLAGGGTGGHLYPALNLAAALRRADPEAELLYLGAERGVEARVLEGREDPPHRLLPFQPLHRSRPWRNWRLLAAAPAVLAGLREAFAGLDPELVVGTGGYAAGPPLLWGLATGRATALQEQNASPGLVTRTLAGRVDQVHLGFPEAEERLRPGRATEVHAHGNPVAVADGGGDDGFEWPEGRVLLVVGGSQGAEGLNRRLLEDLREVRAWPADVTVVWIAGRDHADEVSREAEMLPWSDRVRVVPYVEDLGARLGAVELAVGRAGAMFVAELAAHGVPAVLVPFPGAAGGHQESNAAALVEAGAAVTRREAELERGHLWRTVAGLLADRERLGRMSRAARERGSPEAADRIAADLLRLVRERRGGEDDG